MNSALLNKINLLVFILLTHSFLSACVTVTKQSREARIDGNFNDHGHTLVNLDQTDEHLNEADLAEADLDQDLGQYLELDLERNLDQVLDQDLERNLNLDLGRKAFEKKGPFGYQYHADLEIEINKEESLKVDYIQSSADGKAPLLIFIHGNRSKKEVHSFQAQRLSSWGFHTLSIDLPNRKQWVNNGDRVLRLVNYINAHPEILGGLGKHIDVDKIILIGHSFGGSASIIAAGSGAPVSGIILLDPAVVHPVVVEKMPQVTVPVILLGADKELYKSRKRQKFFDKIESDMIELSLSNTTHNEAQYPSMCSFFTLGFECYSRENQKLFTSAITVSALSLTVSKGLDFAWTIFSESANYGVVKDLKIKGSSMISSNN
ncbi:MAG: dienelactone hydrolase family protein [Oligoflexales bacterium]